MAWRNLAIRATLSAIVLVGLYLGILTVPPVLASPPTGAPPPGVGALPIGAASSGYDSKTTDIRLLNTSRAASATVRLDVYGPSSSTLAYSQTSTVNALGGKSFNQQFMPLPIGFTGGALVSSTEPLLAIINIGGTHSMMGYTGATSGSTEVYLPAILKNAYIPWTTNFSVQNTGTSSATITMTYYNVSGSQVYEASDIIPPSASHLYDQGAMDALGSFFAGSVKIVSTQPVVAQVNEESPTAPDFAAYAGFPAAVAESTVYCPSVLKNAWGWYSDIRVQNVGSESTDVDVEFYDSNGTLVHNIADTIPANTTHGYNQQFIDQLGSFFAGSAKVVSTTQPVVVIVNEAHSSGAFLSYEAFGAAGATQTLYAPSVLKNAWGWYSDVRVQNTGNVAADVQVEFYDFQGVNTHTLSDTIPPKSTKGFNELFISELSDAWEGWAKVTSTNGQPIIAIVNEMHTSGGGVAYGGINQ